MNIERRASPWANIAIVYLLASAIVVACLEGAAYFLLPVFAQSDGSAQVGFLSAAVALVFVVQLFAIRFAYGVYVARPLQRLSGGLEKVADGQVNTRVDAVDAPEFNALAERVNAALDSVMQVVLTADIDDFTGVNSCRRMHQYLRSQIGLARRYDRRLTLAVISIDRLSEINERFGHAAGDTVVRDTAQYIKAGLREVDFVARCGGKEFVVIMPETLPAPAMAVVARLQRECPERVSVARNGVKTPVHISAGVADFPLCAEDADNLLAAATMALHLAKERGRNQVVYFRALKNRAA